MTIYSICLFLPDRTVGRAGRDYQGQIRARFGFSEKSINHTLSDFLPAGAGRVRRGRGPGQAAGSMTGLKSELEAISTEELVGYVVSEEEREAALAVLRKYAQHPATLQLLRHYYLTLPEAREEMAIEVRILAQKQGHYLFALQTSDHEYLYISSEEETLFIGELENGLQDKSILNFFGFKSADAFTAAVAQQAGDAPTSQDSKKPGRGTDSCVACGVGEGEFHLLGCPVEQCPWCDAQLSRCNCRFDQLGVEQIEDEGMLDYFEELLEKKGRVVFKRSQNPSYPTAGDQPPTADRGDPEG